MKSILPKFLRSRFYKREKKLASLININTQEIRIEENCTNFEEISIEKIIISSGALFVNRGKIIGTIVAKSGNIKNLGIIEGIIFCPNGTLSLGKNSITKGRLKCKYLKIQKGATLDVISIHELSS